MSFLGLEGKIILVFGVSTRRSVAYHVAQVLEEEGARVIHAVHTPTRADSVADMLPGREIHACNLTDDAEIRRLAEQLTADRVKIHGIVHSVAFADYAGLNGMFHDVSRSSFLECVSISCYSLIAVAHAFRPLLVERGSVVAISISTTRMAAESYGYMAPAKAALDSSIVFLAKSFSRFSEVRFNAVCPGLLKTSSSAGIPGYADHYLFAEQVTLRKRAVETAEVAHAVAFLLSERSSGINAQGVVVDGGMGVNYFDSDVIRHALAGFWPTSKE